MPTVPSITFLIGGRFSRPAVSTTSRDNEVRADATPLPVKANPRRGRPALLHWYMPCKPSIYNFYRFASETWGDVYGANPYGVVGLDGEPYFGWEKNADPTYDYVRVAAERLLERCGKLRRQCGTQRFRFIGHSAGCFVANMATHLADFDIDQLLLCSPSVPRADSIPHGWTREQIVQTMPNVARLASGKFFYFNVRPDSVLAYLRRDTHYATTLVREELPDVAAASRTPGPLRTADLLLGHWRTVHPRNWLSPPNVSSGTLLEWIASQ